jgi:pimeloyl-ACP methyl ester carboxylesterase
MGVKFQGLAVYLGIWRQSMPSPALKAACSPRGLRTRRHGWGCGGALKSSTLTLSMQVTDTAIERPAPVVCELPSTAAIRLGLLLSAVMVIHCLIGANAAAAELSPCKIAGLAQPARCGVFNMPENPDQPGGRVLPINVAVIPASGGPALPDPIVVLMGGPGEDTISAAAEFADRFAALRRDHDILLVDQRETGLSGALRCDLFSAEDAAASLRDVFPTAAVKTCERRLRGHADLTQYTYLHFASDLEHVRRALGYGQLNLFAWSYGTRAAQVYMRSYPQSVRTVYLGSVVPIDITIPLPFAKTAQTALESTFDACAADSECHAAFPNLRDEFQQILARLDAADVRVPLAGRTGTALLYRGRVAEWIRGKLYRPKSAAILPWVIHRAYLGDWSPAVEDILSGAREVDSGLSFGLLFSITCSGDLAFVHEEDVASETRGTFLGDYRLRQQQAACKLWPKASLPKGYRDPVRSSVPTFFATGDGDGGTPLWFTEHVAQGFSNSLTVILRGQGHTEWNTCIGQLYQQFVHSGAVRGLDASSCPPMPRPPFKTR